MTNKVALLNKVCFLGLLLICANYHVLFAQAVDLTSVDEFFKVTSTLKEGKEISDEQWKDFDNSSGYKEYAERQDQTFIKTIKTSINLVFGNGSLTERDSILSITKEEMAENTSLLLKKLTLINYIDVNKHFDSIKLFREAYNFNTLVDRSKQRLSSFLGIQIDSTYELKPVYFFFVLADGAAKDDGIYIDFNLFYNQTDEKRINFLAHEYFHDFRKKHENHAFNYKCDLNFMLDMIQNEGIADMIDKSEGYEKYFTEVRESPEMISIWVNLYDQAQTDIGRLQDVILKYSKEEISEEVMIDEIIEITKFNGHHIGFFMANQIVKAGYEKEMLLNFNNPYIFFSLYNKTAVDLKLHELSTEFMDYLRSITKEYYQ